MGEGTKISWAHHTFNPWWGCTEVSPACDHCYAREFAKRVGVGWGAKAERRFFGDSHWDEPFRWSRRAEKRGVRERVFCASMADVLEERGDLQGRKMSDARQRLWFVIANTPALDWLLLTKRPRAYSRLLPQEILAQPNVWLGVTCESQEHDWRIEALTRVECAGPRWVSYEPALGPLDFQMIKHSCYAGPGRPHPDCEERFGAKLNWIVVGGESGSQARDFDLLWAEQTIEQGKAAGVSVFVKQLGARPIHGVPGRPRLYLSDRAGRDPEEWPRELRVWQYPRT